ncbi:hypothetical protein PMAYCL1PPCAC_10564, partial [Pristionchus mayeri]
MCAGCFKLIWIAGTVYYVAEAEDILYIKTLGKIIDAKLPPVSNLSFGIGTFGNAFYFGTHNSLFKAVFAPPDVITVTYLRDKLEDEKFHNGLCL